MKTLSILEVISTNEKTARLKVLEVFNGTLEKGEIFNGFYENVKTGDKIMVCDFNDAARYFKIEEF